MWDMDVVEALERDNKDVQEVGYPIARNRTLAEPDIEVEVVPSLLGSVFVIEVGVEVS